MKGWLIVVAITSLALNGIMGYVIYQHSDTSLDDSKRNRARQDPLAYKSFQEQWGKAWIGVEATGVTPQIAAQRMLDRVEGAFITSVVAGSPAQKAGIRPGDVILSFNGRKIRTPDQFRNDVAGSGIGDEVYMCVSKEDRTITVYAVPEERPPHLPAPIKSFPYLGVYVSEVILGSDAAGKLEEAGKAGGVWVEKVIRGSPAEKAGLQEGDIIMSFNFRKTENLREFFSDLAGSDAGARVRMCIMRGDYRKTIYVVLTSGQEGQQGYIEL